MGKGEIHWKGKFEDGKKRQVCAKRRSGNWTFFEREKRFEKWESLSNPSFEDWCELLDAVRRRANRRRIDAYEIDRIQEEMKRRFPQANV